MERAKTGNNKWLLWTHVAAFLFVIINSLRFSIDIAAELCIGLVAAYAVPALMSRLLLKYWSPKFAVVLLGAACIMAFGISQNLEGFLTNGGTLAYPNIGLSDSSRDYYCTIDLINGKSISYVNIGYPLFIYGLFKIFGINCLYPFLINLSFMLFAITLGGATASKLIKKENPSTILFHGALLTALVSNICFYGTIIMKESVITFATTILGFSMAKCYTEKSISIYSILCAVIGTLLLTLCKPPLGYFVLLGSILIFSFKSKKAILNLCFFSFLAVIIISGTEFFRHTNMSPTNVFDKGDMMTKYMFVAGSIPEEYTSLIPNYYTSGLLYRIFVLPLCCIAQFFSPLPWNFSKGLDIVPFYWYDHISIFWYFAGGAMIGFLVFQLFRKSGKGLNRWALWWTLCYIGIAYYSAGTVARYYLPFIPLGMPIALHFLYSIKDGVISAKSAKTYWIVYSGLMIIALAMAYWFLELR